MTAITLAQNTGLSTDLITNAAWSDFLVSLQPTASLSAGNIVKIYSGAALFGQYTVPTAGVALGGTFTVGNQHGLQEHDNFLTAKLYSATGVLLDVSTPVTVTLDTGAPTLLATPVTLPTTTTDVPLDSDIKIAFSENILLGSGTIKIHDDTWQDVRTIDVGAALGQLSITGSTLTINPTLDLQPGKTYHVSLGYGSVTDVAGNAYGGLYNDNIVSFSTTVSGGNFDSPVTVTGLTIDSGVTGDNKTNAAWTGYKLTTTSSLVIGDTVEVFSGTTLMGKTTLTVPVIPGGTVDVAAWVGLHPGDNALYAKVITAAGISKPSADYHATLDITAPTLTQSVQGGSTTYVATTDIWLGFSEHVGLSNTGTIKFVDDDYQDVRTIDLSQQSGRAQVTFAENIWNPGSHVMVINPTDNLQAGRTYHVSLSYGAVTDDAGNAFAGFYDGTTEYFTITGVKNVGDLGTHQGEYFAA